LIDKWRLPVCPLIVASCLALSCNQHAPKPPSVPSPEKIAMPAPPSPPSVPGPPATAPTDPPASATTTTSIVIPARPSGPIEFTDVAAQAGIHFKHNTGAFGKKYLPETMGSGVCFLDYDKHGWQDILFVK
jgi:hypothetical protein